MKQAIESIPENESGLNKELDRMMEDGKIKIEKLLKKPKDNAKFGCFALLLDILDTEKQLFKRKRTEI